MTWESSVWNANIKGDSTPISWFLLKDRSLILVGTLFPFVKLPPVLKRWEVCFSSGWSNSANMDGHPNYQVKLGLIMCDERCCQLFLLADQLLFILKTCMWSVAFAWLHKKALAGVAQWIDCQPVNQKVAGLITGQSTCLGCRWGPQLRACKRKPRDASLSPPAPSPKK